MVVHILDPSTQSVCVGGCRQMGLCESEVSLAYIESSKPAKPTERSCIKTRTKLYWTLSMHIILTFIKGIRNLHTNDMGVCVYFYIKN